jgi:GDPmannose 4,6-dehydratase/GDP-4-dehydro-6-deoxy-D-mannose reductase
METIRRVLITGITGSGGSYLADYLVEQQPDVEVHGLARWHSTSSPRNLDGCLDRVVVHECDLLDFSAVLAVLTRTEPEAIVHLAAHANVRASFVNPLAVTHNNVMGTANLLEAVRAARLDPLILLCSTSEVYGQVSAAELPIRETQAPRPANIYAASKLAQDALGHAYFQSYGLRVIRTRMFTYLNPRRDDLFATSFARQVARIEAGLQTELLHGNLESIRTILDVRDAVAAYWLALGCTPGEVYNIGGTATLSVGDFLEKLRARARCPIPTRLDQRLLRPTDVTLQVPCVDKFKHETGWQPAIALEDSIDELLAHARREVARETLPDTLGHGGLALANVARDLSR